MCSVLVEGRRVLLGNTVQDCRQDPAAAAGFINIIIIIIIIIIYLNTLNTEFITHLWLDS